MLQVAQAAQVRHLPAGGAWSQRVGAFAALPDLIRELGADPAPLLADAGLGAGGLDGASARVPYAALVGVLQHAARGTGCAHLGLLAGRMCQLADLGPVGELTRHSATVGEALRMLTVHQHLDSGGGLGFLIENGATVDLGYAIYHPGVSGTDQMYDCVLAAVFNFLRELCGPSWVPSEILLPHAVPRDVSPYRRLFKAPVSFDAEFGAIRFARHWLDRRVEGNDPLRRRIALERVNDAGAGELVAQVFRALRTLLLIGKDSGDDVASMLSMHRRTLNRRLKAEGTTFRELLDQVRFDVARQLLGDSNISLDDIAATLGYAGVSPFMRTFRRWAGTTPARWRRTTVASRAEEAAMSTRAAHRPQVSTRLERAVAA